MGKDIKTITITLPPEILKEVQRIAKQEGKTKNEIFMDMFGVYLYYLDSKRWNKKRIRRQKAAKGMDVRSKKDIERAFRESKDDKEIEIT